MAHAPPEPPDPATDSGRTLYGIQACRGIAALLVVLYHAERGLDLPNYVGHPAWGGITGFGHAGVDFFFVLSGFIIYRVHHGDIGRPGRLLRYACRRAGRIYPPYWVATALIVLLAVAAHGLGGAPGSGQLLQSLLLIPHGQEPILGVAWTLQREAVFYVLFGLAIIDARLALAGVAAMAAIRLATLPVWLGAAQGFGSSVFDLLFALGIGAAWVSLHLRLRAPVLVLAAGVAWFLAAAIMEDAGTLAAAGWPGRLAYGFASAIIIAGVAASEQAGRLAIGSGLKLLGAASYSIYLVHTLMIGPSAKGLAALGLMNRLPGAAVMAAIVAIAIAGGVVFHLWVERPLGQAAGRATRRLTRPAAKENALA